MINRRLTCVFLILLSFSFQIMGQQLSSEVNMVMDACLKMRSAIGSGNTEGLRQANKELKQCDIKVFGQLRNVKKEELSLNKHFIYDTDFVDSLIVNRNVYRFAQQYAERTRLRATTSSGKVFFDNGIVGKKSSIIYTLAARGRQEIVVITEPKGLITIRIHDKTNDKWYNDTEEVTKGKPFRIKIFDLPIERMNSLEIEIINCGKKDVSFVVIGN